MDKKLRLISFLTLLTVIGYSQTSFQPETNFGLKFGGNISTVVFNPAITQNIYNGLTSGLSFKHIEEKNLGVQIELNYLQAGWKENLDSLQGYSRRLNYISFPFMSHFYFGSNKTRFIINLGPYASYLLSENETIENITEENEQNYYRTTISNRAAFGMCLGFGFTQHTSVGIFQIEGRGNIDLSNIYKQTSEISFASSKNLILELSLTYFLDYRAIMRIIPWKKKK